ncbi:MAG: hypothetical protein Q7T25_12880 [Sideroxyarcus sp.]|nr:hypothetical protein [Sideroxyarcus sp.]
MPTYLLSLFLCLSLFNQSAEAAGKSEKSLTGRWLYQQGNAASEMVLGADGSGTFDGAALAYRVQGNQLLVSMNGGIIAYHFQLRQNQLLLEGGDLNGVVQFTRAGQSASGKSRGPENKQGGKTKDEPLARLLISSDWCSFSYSGGGGGYNSSGSYGRSSTTRFHLSADGSFSKSSNSESYSSNPYGSIAGQGGNGSGGRWQVRAGVLYIAEGNGPMQPVQLTVTKNSNGYPIINSNGTEYMQCN